MNYSELLQLAKGWGNFVSDRINIWRLPYLMLYKGKLDQIIMCLSVEVICKIQTMYVTNLRSGLEYIVKEQNDLAKDYYKKIAQPVRV